MLVPGLPQSAPSTLSSQPLAGSSHQQQPLALPVPKPSTLLPTASFLTVTLAAVPHPGCPQKPAHSKEGVSTSTSPRYNKLCQRQ